MSASPSEPKTETAQEPSFDQLSKYTPDVVTEEDGSTTSQQATNSNSSSEHGDLESPVQDGHLEQVAASLATDVANQIAKMVIDAAVSDESGAPDDANPQDEPVKPPPAELAAEPAATPAEAPAEPIAELVAEPAAETPVEPTEMTAEPAAEPEPAAEEPAAEPELAAEPEVIEVSASSLVSASEMPTDPETRMLLPNFIPEPIAGATAVALTALKEWRQLLEPLLLRLGPHWEAGKEALAVHWQASAQGLKRLQQSVAPHTQQTDELLAEWKEKLEPHIARAFEAAEKAMALMKEKAWEPALKAIAAASAAVQQHALQASEIISRNANSGLESGKVGACTPPPPHAHNTHARPHTQQRHNVASRCVRQMGPTPAHASTSAPSHEHIKDRSDHPRPPTSLPLSIKTVIDHRRNG
jgi:hypothetical protein